MLGRTITRLTRGLHFGAALFGLVAATQPASAQAAPTTVQVDATLATALVRDTLIALNHANFTGNYSVFRDYAAPAFATANDPVRLTAIFAPLRAQRLDLLPALVLTPAFSTRSRSSDDRMRLSGTIASVPRSVRFDLAYTITGSRWRLFGISVSTFDPENYDPLAGPRPAGQQPALVTLPKRRPG